MKPFFNLNTLESLETGEKFHKSAESTVTNGSGALFI